MEDTLQLSDVWVVYAAPDAPRQALAGVSLRVRPGEWVAVVGPNGGGKSTIARVLAGLCPVSRGRAVANGPVAIVWQDPDAQMVGDTVREEVSFGLEFSDVEPARWEERIRRALRDVGLQVDPDTLCDRLSGGQRQLLAIASALAVRASAVVFDEATSMIDPEGRRRVMRAARRLCGQGAGVVWVTQWLEELAHADRVVAVSDGRVAFSGAAREFFYPGFMGGPPAPCDLLGFQPPFFVRAGRALELRTGIPCRPLSEDDLARWIDEL